MHPQWQQSVMSTHECCKSSLYQELTVVGHLWKLREPLLLCYNDPGRREKTNLINWTCVRSELGIMDWGTMSQPRLTNLPQKRTWYLRLIFPTIDTNYVNNVKWQILLKKAVGTKCTSETAFHLSQETLQSPFRSFCDRGPDC